MECASRGVSAGCTSSPRRITSRGARFDDAVAKGDWYIDVHSATKGLVHMDKFQHGEYYEIPYRCLVNDRVANMMTIGRCISTTFLVQASIRIQPTLIDMGRLGGPALAHVPTSRAWHSIHLRAPGSQRAKTGERKPGSSSFCAKRPPR